MNFTRMRDIFEPHNELLREHVFMNRELAIVHGDRLQQSLSREQTLFDRFIYLVNRHSDREHQLSYYAERMCLTERYLGTVIRQASGVTAKEWIDRSLITCAKIELRHTQKSVAQIAEELSFPNSSFFSKYFKRLTQMTPLEYRQS